MPPKKADASKKTQEKVKAKIIEDKTFGLKNKKGAKQQKFIQQVAKQVSQKGVPNRPRDLLDPNEARAKKKEEEAKKKEELTMLFKPVLQTVAKGVDPKSVVCVYFKQGICQKGDKCKFSHDLSKERKSEKRNIYEDVRGQEGMENWDDEKLENVVNEKHGEDNKKKNQTQIVCRYFIEAVENKTYGWFWACPNGENCMYRHALPPGFTLKSEAKKKDEEEVISMEMLVEKERAALGSNVTKVTLESFLAWKARKLLEKKDELKKKDEKKRADYKLGFHNGLTGRDLFTFDPSLIANDDDDDGAADDIDYRKLRAEEDDEAGGEIRDIRADFFMQQAREADGTGTMATDDRFSYLESMLAQENKRIEDRRQQREEQERLDAEACAAAAAAAEEDDDEEEDGEEGDEDDEEDGDEEDEDAAEENVEEEFKKTLKKLDAKSSGLTIDESLFNAEDLPDLDEELEKLEI